MARPADGNLHRRGSGDRRSSAGRPPGGTLTRRARPAASRPVWSPAEVATAAQLACLLEASAPKPGNVSPAASFHDTHYEDFLASAAAIGPALARVVEQSLGATILQAVEATRRWTRANTNLGIVLLLAPLARAALDPAAEPLPARVVRVLDAASIADSAQVYAAIRLAAPAGLGRVPEQDVADAPSVPLRPAMALAAGRDAVAREYATGFATTFGVGVPALARARAAGLAWPDAVVETYLALLAAAPDTHIARKLGPDVAAEVSRQAAAVRDAGGVRTDAGRAAVAAFDAALRDARNTRNPGATADLTAAALFAALLGGAWR